MSTATIGVEVSKCSGPKFMVFTWSHSQLSLCILPFFFLNNVKVLLEMDSWHLPERQTVIQKILNIVFLCVLFVLHFSQNWSRNFISSLNITTLSFVASYIFQERQFWLGPKYFQVFIYCSQLSLQRPSTHLISHQKKNFYWITSSHVHTKDQLDGKFSKFK